MNDFTPHDALNLFFGFGGIFGAAVLVLAVVFW